ncbi:hypothetical protein C8250_004415 [Streptomyces sp. So13.3]|uniref:hypothetical protein n=1 Tax=Streptomyces TaxID=1883 RepID=UPI001106733E|nr:MULTISPECIES: hypothetical protein [Streptomyces]MCZ4095141.1 hypothetical protein [Streptomyces sp. H39-C1]QNA71258.1 hypothetical protein C8250_004415 [Streptomyces sp. So13.3]
MTAEGIGNPTIDTPLGKQHVRTEGVLRPDGSWHGTARDRRSGEEVPLTDIAVDGGRLTWKQSIPKPLRLHLVYALVVDGDRLTGKAKAGRLPAATVTGERADAAEPEPGVLS